MKPENYIKSQRFKYLTFGLLAGFFIGLTQEPYRTPLIVFFVLFGIIMSWMFWRKK